MSTIAAVLYNVELDIMAGRIAPEVVQQKLLWCRMELPRRKEELDYKYGDELPNYGGP
jgi:hypothetical protein